MTDLKPGKRYKITNVKAGTVLDLSGAGCRSLIGYPYKGYDNQHWKVERTETGWLLRNVFNGQYLSFEGPPGDGATLIVSPFHAEWQIRQAGEQIGFYRILLPGTAQHLDLSNQDSSIGTPVILATWWQGKSQIWRFDPV